MLHLCIKLILTCRCIWNQYYYRLKRKYYNVQIIIQLYSRSIQSIKFPLDNQGTAYWFLLSKEIFQDVSHEIISVEVPVISQVERNVFSYKFIAVFIFRASVLMLIISYPLLTEWLICILIFRPETSFKISDPVIYSFVCSAIYLMMEMMIIKIIITLTIITTFIFNIRN